MDTLTPAERKELRARAHHLDPVVLIGDGGLTDPVMAEIERALVSHELIKIRVFGDDREARAEMMARISRETGAQPVQIIGKLLVLYRENPKTARKPVLSLGDSAARPARAGAAPRRPARNDKEGWNALADRRRTAAREEADAPRGRGASTAAPRGRPAGDSPAPRSRAPGGAAPRGRVPADGAAARRRPIGSDGGFARSIDGTPRSSRPRRDEPGAAGGKATGFAARNAARGGLVNDSGARRPAGRPMDDGSRPMGGAGRPPRAGGARGDTVAGGWDAPRGRASGPRDAGTRDRGGFGSARDPAASGRGGFGGARGPAEGGRGGFGAARGPAEGGRGGFGAARGPAGGDRARSGFGRPPSDAPRTPGARRSPAAPGGTTGGARRAPTDFGRSGTGFAGRPPAGGPRSSTAAPRRPASGGARGAARPAPSGGRGAGSAPPRSRKPRI